MHLVAGTSKMAALVAHNDPTVINDELIRICIQVRSREPDMCQPFDRGLLYSTANGAEGWTRWHQLGSH